MSRMGLSRRNFLAAASAVAGSSVLRLPCSFGQSTALPQPSSATADYSLTIANKTIELAPKHIVSVTTYNGQFPGPLLRFKEGRQVTVDVHNETDSPEQLHWHGQNIPSDVDGAAEERTPYIPAHGSRRITFVPNPSGLRFYHTHLRAGSDLSRGTYSGLAGPVFIEPKDNPGDHDHEVFLKLKEFEPTFSRGGDMDMKFLWPATTVKSLKDTGEGAMEASLAKGSKKGYEVEYGVFTINGRMLGHGEPIRVKQGERVLFHILNASAGEIRSLALPGHTFSVVSMDGNQLPKPVQVPGLWIGTAERISAVVEMNHPGVWVMGDVSDDDRGRGMGVVVEYAGSHGKPVWNKPQPFKWNYAEFGPSNAPARTPDEIFDMLFAKDNAALEGFNRWTINGVSYPTDQMMAPPLFHLKEGKRYRLRMRNASDDIHPVHLHRHTFELTKVAGQPTSGVRKDVVMVGGYQEMEVDFTANNQG